MSRIPQEQFRYWSCVRKKWFRTQAQAESAIINMTMRAYHCGFCDGWHLATKREGGEGPKP